MTPRLEALADWVRSLSSGEIAHRVYVDTGALIALIWRRDRAHERMRAHYQKLRESRDALLTSNLVLAENNARVPSTTGSFAPMHSWDATLAIGYEF